MIKQPNMRLIGLFIIGSAIAFFLMFGYFLKSKFNTDEATVVMYFDESVKGLDVGAPVLFKGVKIGEVSKVRLQANLKTMSFIILVYAKIYHGQSLQTDKESRKEWLNRFIQEGLRARLAINSVITGQLLIELDMLPKTKIVLHNSYDDDIYEIPTVSSPFAEISKSLQVMPIGKIAQDIDTLTEALSKNVPPLLVKMNETLNIFEQILKENKNNTTQMVEEIGGAAQSVNELVNNNAASITQMIESFGAAAQSMKNLTDYLQMNPSAIITGKEY